MTLGLIGTKYGSTRVFDELGVSIPVTVVGIMPNMISQIKTLDSDGYSSLQLSTGQSRRANKPMQGHFKKAGIEAGRYVNERCLAEAELSEYEVAQALNVTYFTDVKRVHVSARTKGKGFQGCVKRHHFSMQDATHGNSLAHRASGSIGQCQDPGRVFPGKKMAGRMGNVQRTIRNLTVVGIDEEKQLLLIKGAVPGPKGGKVIVVPAEWNNE